MWRRHSCRPRPDSSGRLPGGITAATVVLPSRMSWSMRAQQAHHLPRARPWPAVFSATRGVILGRREPEAPILKTCLLGLLIACLCASAADLPKLPPETMGLIDQARSLPPEFSADTLL